MANLSRLPKVVHESWEWQHDGACVAMASSVFFSPDAERGAAKRQREARATQICSTCPVIDACRRHALSAREPYGVWGGLTSDERERMLASAGAVGTRVA